MARSAGSGDRLARGAAKVSYLANEDNNISDKKWADAFKDFNNEEFQKKETVKDPNAVKADKHLG